MSQTLTQTPTEMTARVPRGEHGADDTLWYKDAIIYQVHVKAFGDSNGDGIGDFRGLTERLDYIQQLGVNTVWVLPFYPSPQRDDGYDIAEYEAVHANYGTMEDAREFIAQAHARDLRVVTELIINHTSDQHAWFQRARSAPKGSPERDFYVWSDDDAVYDDARIIFTDTETSNWAWDPVAKQYYWHRFFSHQPDLNFDNPEVLKAVLGIMEFWCDIGVDGLRLDAIPYLIEREGTSCENLEETHDILKAIRAALDAKYADRMLLAEANQWPEDVREYFGDGDECHMAYHFPVMPRMYMAVAQEDRHPIIDIMGQTPDIPDNCQWAIFLRNHDELTLEMVTDRERDYMYRQYAADPRMRINVGIRRRLAPLLDNDQGKIRLMNSLLLSLLGTPVMYYGDEIGMGDNIYLGDRNGVRTPMQWSPDRNAGFSRADPQSLYLPPVMDPIYGYEAVNVEAQSRSPSSLLNWMRRMIGVRKRHPAFGRGSFRFLAPANRKILAYLREYEDSDGKTDVILCVANLGRTPQPVELDLAEFEGRVPVELIGRTEFPRIGDLPYLLTLPGHEFYWFEMTENDAEPEWRTESETAELPLLVMATGWQSLFAERQTGTQRALAEQLRGRFVGLLPDFLENQRWFAAKGETIAAVELERLQVWEHAGGSWLLAWVDVAFAPGEGGTSLESQRYFLPLAMTWSEDGDELTPAGKAASLARVRRHSRLGMLHDAFTDPAFCRALAHAMGTGAECPLDGGGMLAFNADPALPGLLGLDDGDDVAAACLTLDVELAPAQGSNTAVLLSRTAGSDGTDSGETEGVTHRVFLKGYRRLQRGVHAELEIGRFLAESTAASRVAPLGGSLELVDPSGNEDSSTAGALAILQGHVSNQGDAWTLTTGYLERFVEDHLLVGLGEDMPSTEPGSGMAAGEAPGVHDGFLLLATTLGRRTADLHRAFVGAEGTIGDPAFAPEPVSDEDVAGWAAATRRALAESLEQLDARLGTLSPDAARDAERLLGRRDALLARIDATAATLAENASALVKTRHHGDYHLGQVLVNNNDFVIIDFEGEPARSLAERRARYSPLKDIGGMLRSLDYAGANALERAVELWPGNAEAFEAGIDDWRRLAAAAFLEGYRASDEGQASLWPERGGDEMLTLMTIDKALYELRYELAMRPDWVQVPVRGLLRLTEEGE